jgi:7,8-dihydropterin-6-yl-methyl-4-(beta-D-ribofuranosyl)aminobenzene 5'-phosphate synthase
MLDAPHTVITRRAVIGVSALAMAALSTRAYSAAPHLTVPIVDSLTLQVVTDAATFGPFLDNLDLPGMKVLRAGNGGPPNPPRMLPQALLAEFGLSILCASTMGSQRRTVMVDFGYSKEVLATNLRLLGIDANTVDAAVLSHGHLDHYGGFGGLFGAGPPPQRRVPLTVGGEETFCERVALIGNPPPVMGTLDRAALAAAGFDVKIDSQPAIIAGHGFTTGIIPLESAERAAIPTRMHPGVGCDRERLAPAKRTASDLPDDGEHELATCYAVNGLGLVVIASCSHRGVINSIRRAQAVSGIQKVHAVLGGFHLVRPRTPAEVKQTVADFAAINPTYIVPMHCSGEAFMAEATRVMPEKVIRSYVGSQFVFAAGG